MWIILIICLTNQAVGTQPESIYDQISSLIRLLVSSCKYAVLQENLSLEFQIRSSDQNQSVEPQNGFWKVLQS